MSIEAPPLSADPPAIPNTLPWEHAIGSLWRRIFAYFLDAIILGIAGWVVTFPFRERLSHVGAWGPLLGSCLALPYFVILNSRIGDGQTLGKRIMDLQVVDVHGNTIPLTKSLVRYSFFAVALYLQETAFPITRLPLLVSSLIVVLIYVISVATFYLVIFNRHTRQGVHDLAAGTYVTDADILGPVKTPPIWKVHWVVLAVLLTTVWILGGNFAGSGVSPAMLQDARLVESMDGVQQAQVRDLNWLGWKWGRERKIFVINVLWQGNLLDEEAFACQVATRVLQNDPQTRELDSLRVVITTGYDLGFTHWKHSNSYGHTPAEWDNRDDSRSKVLPR